MVSCRQEVTEQPVQESHEHLQCHSALQDLLARKGLHRQGLTHCHCHWHAATADNTPGVENRKGHWLWWRHCLHGLHGRRTTVNTRCGRKSLWRPGVHWHSTGRHWCRVHCAALHWKGGGGLGEGQRHHERQTSLCAMQTVQYPLSFFH